ncbi:hypothetical protein GCM10023149_47490 [Mucilaginibacter gynuensis]|uniref:Nucleotidyltransferase AbiEii toxin of type IV toxin-antitoxin system n=1 Tax=Mucilaginibacter gynuensis TaxID=1302236 RepID=A0ABP8HE04_9SPHI
MSSFERHINNILKRVSKDEDFGIAVKYFVDTLESLKIDYIVMGSTAIQSYLDYFHRTPGDIDILLSEQAIELLRLQCLSDELLKFEFNEVASKVHYKNGVFLHLVPTSMKVVDKIENVIFTKIEIYYPDRVNLNKLNLVNFQEEVTLKVPIIEYMFCLNLLVQLDSNNFSDNVLILSKYKLDEHYLQEFLSRVPQMHKVINVRFKALVEKIQKYRPDLVSALPLIDF